nr:PREDICTED: uncharacterized protein LOC109031743 isoform X1 [Bemisia tabaci]
MDSNTPVMFITANVGSIFENPTVMLKIWTEEFLSTVSKLNPKFIALHCQEVGGKNYEHCTQPVEEFVKLLIDSEELRLFDKVRVFLDEDFSKAENFTALGNFYFIHESIEDLLIWDFKEMNFCTVFGKEVYSGSIEDVPIKEKSKFPQDLFPECKWSRKGFLRTRWNLNGSVFDLVNIHLFHDASNFIAMETSPSIYSVTRQRALEYTLDRFQSDNHGSVPFFLFGDFNFRTNTQAVIERLVDGLNPVQVQSPNSNSVQKLLYRKDGEEVVLTLGKKEFVHSNHQQIFIENAGEWLKEYDVEKDSFDGILFEFPISFPPSYPFEEDAESGSHYTTTRCPAWCDRVVLSSAAKNLIHEISKDGSVEYELMGKQTCMGDHKPVYLRANLVNQAGTIEQTLNHVVNPFMLVLCACKLKKILSWQHEKRTPSSHVNKSTRLAVVEENGSLTLFPDTVETVANNKDQFTLKTICDQSKSLNSSNKFLVENIKEDSCKKKMKLEKSQAEDLKFSKCDCIQTDSNNVHSSSLNSRILNEVTKSKSESNLKSVDWLISPQDVSSHVVGGSSESSKLMRSLSDSLKVVQAKTDVAKREVETAENMSAETTFNVDSIVDSLDSDEALIVNFNHCTEEINQVKPVESCENSSKLLKASQRISISKLKLDSPASERSAPAPPIHHHYKRLVKRVHSASLIENKRTIVLKKTGTCHCMTNSNEVYIDILGDEYRTRSSSISVPNHKHNHNRRMKLISDPVLKTSLPRLISHHSSSDEEWYEQVLDPESPTKQLVSKSISSNENAKLLSKAETERKLSVVDVISTVNVKTKLPSAKKSSFSDCKLFRRLKQKKDNKEEDCKSCNCCVIL